MPVSIKFSTIISNSVSNLISHGNYEKLIENLLNDSSCVFKSKYVHIKKQPKGEPDYIDEVTKEKFDVKLFLSKEQGKFLATKKILDYSKIIVQITNELHDCAIDSKTHKIEKTLFYNIIFYLISKIKNDEHLIVFVTYPITLTTSTSITDCTLNDYLDLIFDKLKKYFAKRHLYFIYPTLDNKITLRDMNLNKKEFLNCPEFNRYFITIPC